MYVYMNMYTDVHVTNIQILKFLNWKQTTNTSNNLAIQTSKQSHTYWLRFEVQVPRNLPHWKDFRKGGTKTMDNNPIQSKDSYSSHVPTALLSVILLTMKIPKYFSAGK